MKLLQPINERDCLALLQACDGGLYEGAYHYLTRGEGVPLALEEDYPCELPVTIATAQELMLRLQQAIGRSLRSSSCGAANLWLAKAAPHPVRALTANVTCV